MTTATSDLRQEFSHFFVPDIPRLLRQLRQRSGLSLSALALKTDMSVSALSQFESGRRRPPLATLDRLLAAQGYRLRLEIVNGSEAFCMVSELEIQMLQALDNRQYGRAVRLLSALMEPLDKIDEGARP